MKYCPECGQKLPSGTEKFCPECGQKLVPKVEGGETTNIDNTSGDVIGTGIIGNKNVVGKEFAYTREGNAIVVNINNPSSQEIVEVFKNVMATATRVEQTSISKEDVKTKIQESSTVQQQIKSVLDDVNNIEENTGTEIKEIKAGDLQISRNELELKGIILKANEHYYKNEYNEAIEWYDKAIEIDPNNVDAYNNKGNTLHDLGKYDEAIECYDKALQIDPNSASAWDNKGAALYNLGKYEEAMECYDKAIEIDPNYTLARNNKTYLLDYLSKEKKSSYAESTGSNKKIKWYTADGEPVYE